MRVKDILTRKTGFLPYASVFEYESDISEFGRESKTFIVVDISLNSLTHSHTHTHTHINTVQTHT